MSVDNFDLNNLDKSNWKTHRFDEIAQNISERVDPNNTDLKVYIGLEHIDSQSLHIKRFGTPDDVSGQKLKFYKGDIIFGRRRAYQRKAGIATCDGFCSAHALVLRANPEVIDPRLFKFFLHSDLFMNRAVDISVGSLSPTINWGTLKSQEFTVPPKKHQSDIVELLDAMEDMIQTNQEKIDRFDTLFTSWLNNKVCTRHGWPMKPLSSVAKVQTGIAKNKTLQGEKGVVSRPYLRVANVQDGYLDLDEIKSISVREKDIARFSLEDGDLLLTEGGDFDKLGRGFVWQGEVPNCLHQNHVFAVRTDRDVLNPWFLSLVTRSKYGKQYFLRCAKKTSNLASINSSQLKEFRTLVPPMAVQDELVNEMFSIHETEENIQVNKRSLLVLKKSLTARVF